MKKFTFYLIMLMIMATLSCAQSPDTVLKNKRYNAISATGRLQELSATGDSLIVTYSKDGVLEGKDTYQIIKVVPRGVYSLVIVKMDASSFTLVTPKGRRRLNIPLFGAFVFRFEKEDSHLMVLHDGRLWLTAKEAGDTYAAIRLSGEYFNMWYVTDRFARFVQYPSLNDADSLKVEKVALDWIKKLMEHRAKKLSTYNTDRSGADYGRDNLTKVLVNNHLSPLATPADFNIKLKQYHLNLVPTSRATSRDSTFRHQQSTMPANITD
jgi:hypothetical protein